MTMNRTVCLFTDRRRPDLRAGARSRPRVQRPARRMSRCRRRSARPSREIVPSLIVMNAPRRQPAGRQADAHRRRAQLDRVRRPPGAGGRAFAHDAICWRNGRRTGARASPKDPPNATVSVFSTDGSKSAMPSWC